MARIVPKILVDFGRYQKLVEDLKEANARPPLLPLSPIPASVVTKEEQEEKVLTGTKNALSETIEEKTRSKEPIMLRRALPRRRR